jgi:hypothetical protein
MIGSVNGIFYHLKIYTLLTFKKRCLLQFDIEEYKTLNSMSPKNIQDLTSKIHRNLDLFCYYYYNDMLKYNAIFFIIFLFKYDIIV